MKEYKKITGLADGVWLQTLMGIISDPQRDVENTYYPEQIKIYSHFSNRAENLEGVINGDKNYISPLDAEQYKSSNSTVFYPFQDKHKDTEIIPVSHENYNKHKLAETIAFDKGITDSLELSRFEAIFDSVYDSELIVIGSRSQEYEHYVQTLADIYSHPLMNQRPDILVLTKGLFKQGDKSNSAYEVLKSSKLPEDMRKAVLYGPTIALQILGGTNTRANIAFKADKKEFEKYFNDLAHLINRKGFTVSPSIHPNALGFGSAIKNVYAIASGVLKYVNEKGVQSNFDRHGKYGANITRTLDSMVHNLDAGLIPSALLESKAIFRHLSLKHMWDKEALDIYDTSISSAGDLIATMSSKDSRNVDFGYRLAEQLDGKSKMSLKAKLAIVDDLTQNRQVIEGLPTLQVLHEQLLPRRSEGVINKLYEKMQPQNWLSAPLFSATYELVYGTMDLDEYLSLLTKTAKSSEEKQAKVLQMKINKLEKHT